MIRALPKIFFIILMCLISEKICAQRSKYIIPADTTLHKVNTRPIYRKIYKPRPLSNQISAGILYYNLGSSLSFKKYKTDDEFEVYRGFYVNIGQIKSPRELKISGIRNFQDPDALVTRFVYAKANNLLNFQGGYAYKRKISGFLENKNVVIYGLTDAGLSLGFLKPYYLQLARDNGGAFVAVDEKYSDGNASIFLDKAYIFGKSPFKMGLNESKIQIGANAKVGLQFEYLPSKMAGIQVELGLLADVFTSKQIILINENAKQVYPGAFVCVRYCLQLYQKDN